MEIELTEHLIQQYKELEEILTKEDKSRMDMTLKATKDTKLKKTHEETCEKISELKLDQTKRRKINTLTNPPLQHP
jgi:hypothetical protein